MALRQCKNYIRRFDEYYTRYEHVEDIFNRYIPEGALKDKIIYCPCDSPNSNFVIYLKEHKDDLGYKELIYTWDDYNTHMDLFEYCDVIITNPPFSKIVKELIPILNKVDKEFFILGGAVTIGSYYIHFNDKNINYIAPNEWFDFILPEGCELKSNPRYLYISNLNINNYKRHKINNKAHYTNIYGDYYGHRYKNYDRIDYVPLDEYDEILVPVTVIYKHNQEQFDIIDPELRCNDIQYTDNKPRYIRCLVKRKKLKQQP